MPTREDFEMALAIAQSAFEKLDPETQAASAGAFWHPPETNAGQEDAAGRIVVPFLATHYEILRRGAEVGYRDQDKEPALWEKILVLHYVHTADGSPLSQELISFNEIPNGRLYVPTFQKRAVAPLLGRFGADPEELLEPARALGGRRGEPGDFSVTIPAFPRVPVTLVFWRGDEEFAASLSILFDRTVEGYLPTEDIVLTAQMLAFRLIGIAGRPSRS